jgi:hypothetical protein
MLAFLQLLGMFIADLFRPRRQLEVENLFLRHQLNIALRGAPHRARIRGSDWALFVWMTWLWLRRHIERSGTIVTTPILFGLHHCYARMWNAVVGTTNRSIDAIPSM